MTAKVSRRRLNGRVNGTVYLKEMGLQLGDLPTLAALRTPSPAPSVPSELARLEVQATVNECNQP